METYFDFLASKTQLTPAVGMPTTELSFNPGLKGFQQFIVETALQKGCYALFEDCGLGKTFQQLEWARHVVAYTQKPVLVLTPLAVAAQTIDEGLKFGICVMRLNPAESVAGTLSPGIYVTNYEQVENLDPTVFGGVVLDESSILKNFTGHTKRLLLEYFSQTPFRLACTATPSPNDPMELGNHAEFLGVMTRQTMLATYFTHDGGDTSKWRLKGHAEATFWQWVATWAACLSSPANLGFDATGYVLPELRLDERQVTVPVNEDSGLLFGTNSINATGFNAELRDTLEPRMQAAAAIVAELPADEPAIIWINQDVEGDRLRQLLPDAVEVRGSDKPSVKEARLMGFARGEFRLLITKKKIAQFGLNYQHCAHQVFAALDFSFEGFYQALRRSYRFGQTRPVTAYLITTPSMGNVRAAIRQKQDAHDKMHQQLAAAISHIQDPIQRTMSHTPTPVVERGSNFDFYLGDCCEQMRHIADESIHFSIFSPPFAELYVYSGLTADMGNSANYEQFREHFRFLVPELHRTLLPGRLVAVHCMDLPIQKGKEGFIGLRDFSGAIREEFEAAGFIYHDRITIWKDPVVEMQRTKSLGLLHKQLKKDSAMSRTGIPDYLLVFRKRGDNPLPIRQTVAVDTWQKWASPVWFDINYSKTLQREPAREQQDEKHICPLQLETIERAIALWSNPGETVLTPFGGIGSEGYQALKMNRRAVLIELKESYWRVGVRNCQAAEDDKRQMTIWDLMEGADEARKQAA
ncbi:DNA methyltransferase [Hymenobacter metallilatus]|nr:DNA methyltransferase [Hymenobacter metallilatus]